MPDWSYHPLLAPALRRLGSACARDLALRGIGALARAPGGPALIALVGNMQPPPGVGVDLIGLSLASRTGMACDVDPQLLATAALARFGVGCIEVGPVERSTLDHVADQLGRNTRCGVPVFVRIAGSPSETDLTSMLPALSSDAAAFILESAESLRCARKVTTKPLLLSCETPELTACKADGYVVAPCALRQTRRVARPGAAVIARASVAEPVEALELFADGADLVLLEPAGLARAGPGLPKRINEAVLACSAARSGQTQAASTWLPLFLLGVGMLVGGALAWLVAVTRVVLPYDEAFLGLDREALPSINDRLLAFMAHDRVTLAGTMLSIGVLYSGLAVWGVRRGAHWAWLTIVVSAGTGFASFFLFLGFGYFDPLHAFVSVVLLVVFAVGLFGRPAPGALGDVRASLRNSAAWRRGLWAQLIFVVLGAAVIVAGLAIAAVGISGVLVAEDVGFLHAPAAVLRAANPRLLPLVAHDRAGFGGALVSDGLTVLLTSLWGFREGARWVWWTLLGAGLAGFGAAIGVHVAVGYLNGAHLAPAMIGAALLALGLTCSYPYLCATSSAPPMAGARARFM